MKRANISNRTCSNNSDNEKSNWKTDFENIPLSNIFEAALNGGTCHILLVEDHVMCQMLAKRFLLKCGYTVDAVFDGENAIAKAAEKKYDVILMDLHLPNLDGFEATEQIRALNGINQKTPILALTNSSEYEIRERMYATGMDDYIGKPFNPKELYQKVKYYAF
jgi:CheY-like chemotaxis protein